MSVLMYLWPHDQFWRKYQRLFFEESVKFRGYTYSFNFVKKICQVLYQIGHRPMSVEIVRKSEVQYSTLKPRHTNIIAPYSIIVNLFWLLTYFWYSLCQCQRFVYFINLMYTKKCKWNILLIVYNNSSM